MNWIIASFLMFFASVGLYLGLRKSTLLKTHTQLNNLAMFLLPAIFYLLLAWYSKEALRVTQYELLIILLSAFLFSYLGNAFSLKSIELAPNPGYSLVLSKSYVVFTTLAAVIFLNEDISIKSALGIIAIVAFSPLVIISNIAKRNTETNSKWIPLSFGAFFCWGLLALTSKYLLNLGVSIYERLIFSMLIVSALILTEVVKKKISIRNLTKVQISTLIFIGLMGAAFNYYMQLGFQLAPNIGYVNAINAASIAVVTLAATLLFKDEFNFRKLIGVLGISLGLAILVI